MAEKNYTIDGLRLLGAFCVVVLHSPLGGLPNALALGLRLGSRWAVPFFFMVSGYFAAKGLKPGQELNLGRTIGRLTAVLLVADVVYALYYTLDGDPSTALGFSFVKLIVGQVGHLWYIGAAIVGFILLHYFSSRYPDAVLLVVALGVFGLILAGEGYAQLTGFHLQYEVARYLTAIPFLFGGFLLARHEELLRKVPVVAWLLLALAGLGLEAAEAILLYKHTGAGPHNQELLLGTALFGLGIFGCGLALRQPPGERVAGWGRQYSLLIYLYHVLVISILYSLLHLGDYSPWFYYLSPFIVFGVTVLLIASLARLSPKLLRVISGG